ncbi:MAG: type II toxin-antitoxin system Phd/YefM family antitoxin [Legionella sp.]|jgi:hypothetical protein
MDSVTIEDAKKSFEELVEKVQIKPIQIKKGSEIVAVLVSYNEYQGFEISKLQSIKQQIKKEKQIDRENIKQRLVHEKCVQTGLMKNKLKKEKDSLDEERQLDSDKNGFTDKS